MSDGSIWRRPDLDPASLTLLQEGSLGGHLGITVTEVGPEFLRATMPVDSRTLQPHGRLHGGASVALAETVGSMAANLTLDPSRQVAVGLEINANHARPVRKGLVTATATPEALGRTTQIWSIRIVDEFQKLVCISRLTMAIIPVERG
ncbi:hotdog fold thioesterase [Sphingomonas sp.]|uniref:hotdog fold thioesterase n=1 Tax=Sphingomonas sp. TaxID=28214 RepID=UPI003CC575E4